MLSRWKKAQTVDAIQLKKATLDGAFTIPYALKREVNSPQEETTLSQHQVSTS